MQRKKFTHLLGSSVLSSALVLSIGTGGAVFANETDSTTTETKETSTLTQQVETQGTLSTVAAPSEETTTQGTQTDVVTPSQETTTQSTQSDVVAPSQETTTQDTQSNQVTTTTDTAELKDTNLEKPSLIPGDFFYFIKILTEKIRLAVTADENKEAKLLAEFAAERIAEANALLSEGKTAEAEKLLKEAISTQEVAGEKLPESKIETVENTAGTTTNPTGENEGNVTEKTNDVVESQLANNIHSALAVLEKIENPQAQQAIMKNIQKSFEKMEKKFKKLEEADAKFAEKMKEIEEKLASGQISIEEATHKKAKLAEELNNKIQKIQEEETRDVEELNNEITKATEEAAQKAEEKQREEAKKGEEKE